MAKIRSSLINDVNLRKITYFLCRHEGEMYYPSQLRDAMSPDLDEEKLRKELKLHKSSSGSFY